MLSFSICACRRESAQALDNVRMGDGAVGLLARIVLDIGEEPFLVARSQFVRVGLIVGIVQKFPRSAAYGPLLAEAPLQDLMGTGSRGGADHGDQTAPVQFGGREFDVA